MKRQIRQNVFETNSSSTHSICITKSNLKKKDIGTYVHFSIGEFGWEYDTLYDTSSKASYLYTAILINKKQDLIKDIKKILDDNNIEYEFEEPKYSGNYLDNGYIDHGGEIPSEFFNICKDKDRLFKYLFSSESYIVTGNDNSDNDRSITARYDHEEYYKGN